ncbi:MAG: helix-turn-helix domain-containing protein, partial [Chloroflexota bacterium]
MNEFGTRLRALRVKCTDPQTGKPLSQQRLGGLLREKMGAGVSGAAVSDWELGKSKIHADDRLFILGLAQLLREYGGIASVAEANDLLEAGNYRALNPVEIQRVFPETPPDASDPSPLLSNGSTAKSPLWEDMFPNANEAWTAMLEKAKEGPSPAWPRVAAALLRNLSDRLTAPAVLRALIFVWIWWMTGMLIVPSLRWPFSVPQEMLRAVGLYVAGTLTLPLLIGLLAETKTNAFWRENQLANSALLRMYTHQGAFVGFHVGYFAVVLLAAIRFSLHLPSTTLFEWAAMLAPLVMGTVGARVVPYNLWRAFGRLNLRDGGVFFVFVLLGPVWGFFLVQFSSLLINPG